MKTEQGSYLELEVVTVRLLAENTARGMGIRGEHGLSWWLESGEKRLIFDLGQGLVVGDNAKSMGIELKDADAVVFSHGHLDHVGGWRVLAANFKEALVYLHPSALELKYSKLGGGLMKSACDENFPESLKEKAVKVVEAKEPVEVLPGVWTTGEVPRVTDYEDTGGAFYHGPGGCEEDPILDDMSLFFNTSRGVVVVLGCAHAGIVNILYHIRDLTGQRIHAVVGGTHLLNATEERMEKTIAALKAIGPDWIGPNHCTGDAAVVRLWSAFPGQTIEIHAGQSLTFPYRGK